MSEKQSPPQTRTPTPAPTPPTPSRADEPTGRPRTTTATVEGAVDRSKLKKFRLMPGEVGFTSQ